MKQPTSILLFGLGMFLGVLVLASSTAKPAQAANLYQDNPCAGLTPEQIRAGGVSVLRCRAHCLQILSYGDVNTWSDEQLWSCINDSGSQPGDQPVEEQPPYILSCAGVTLEDFYSENPEYDKCRLVCKAAALQSDKALRNCIQYYGGQPDAGDDQQWEDMPPITPADQSDSEPPKSLGPLATNPIVPLAGALIGTLVGWLASVAVTSGNVLKTWTAPPPAQKPLKPVSGPPQTAQVTPATDVEPPASPAEAPQSKSAGEHLWDIAVNVVGSSATVTGSLSEFFDFQEDAETLKKLRSSIRAWRQNPTKETADTYLKNLRKTTNVRLSRASEALGNAANVLDIADGVVQGLKKASEGGYSGTDKILVVGAELSKKALNYALTKNPMVGLVNSAVGGLTEMAYGKEGRIDIGSIIDKGAEAWENVTQEYATYTGGDWFAPRNEDFADVLANDPEIRRKDQYLHGIRQIKKLVEQGKLSRQEGSARIRHLRKTMLGDE